jgi:hypothetical protein
MYRGDLHCMTGGIGWLADRTVQEDGADGTPRFAKWSPPPNQRAALTASHTKSALEATGGQMEGEGPPEGKIDTDREE